MRNAASIFLLVVMVSTQTPIGQLYKLPLLIQHFIKHQKQDGVSFVAFLDNHYSANHNDADLPEDQQLPFKTFTLSNTGFAIMTPVIQTTVVVPLPADKLIMFRGIYVPQRHLASIFHPPRS